MTSAERLEWLKTRQTGIGGSDVAAILGLSRYKSALDVYNDKVGEVSDSEQSQAAYWGTQLEDIVAKEFQKRTGMKVQKINSQLSRDGWMHANIDRAVVNPEISGNVRVLDEAKQLETGRLLTTDSILECKTASSFIADQWGPSQEAEIVAGKAVVEHKIPIYYETQVQWYMGVTGAKRCYVAALLGGQDFRIYCVERDDDVIDALQQQCREFWFERVLKQVPPSRRRKKKCKSFSLKTTVRWSKQPTKWLPTSENCEPSLSESRNSKVNKRLSRIESAQPSAKRRASPSQARRPALSSIRKQIDSTPPDSRKSSRRLMRHTSKLLKPACSDSRLNTLETQT